MNQNELYHFGIKGMRWGVRRYQNYDGSYTKKGLERYKKAESAYESAKSKYKTEKDSYKKGMSSRQNVKSKKNEMKEKERELKRSYKNLKYEKMADEGRKLYAQGKTITGNSMKAAYTEGAIVLGGNVAGAFLSTYGNETLGRISAGTITLGGTAVNAMIAAKTQSENKKLRAYYARRSGSYY